MTGFTPLTDAQRHALQPDRVRGWPMTGPTTLTGRHVVVTGAAGSIGTQLCKALLLHRPASLTMVSLTEHHLVALERLLQRQPLGGTQCCYVLGSVCDAPLMNSLVASADVVVHLAAHKHVPVCEANIPAAVWNNVQGTLTVLRAAQLTQGCQVLNVSTDKAVPPVVSVMGATKRLAERLVAGCGPGYTSVRFGNVLETRGSVLPLWREQIARGGPVTVSDAGATRYFMRGEEACELILTVLQAHKTGTYVFDMGPPQNILALAQALLAGTPHGYRIPLVFTGLRPGERLHESLSQADWQPTAHPKVFAVPSAPSLALDDPCLGAVLAAAHGHDVAETRRLLWLLVHENAAAGC